MLFEKVSNGGTSPLESKKNRKKLTLILQPLTYLSHYFSILANCELVIGYLR